MCECVLISIHLLLRVLGQTLKDVIGTFVAGFITPWIAVLDSGADTIASLSFEVHGVSFFVGPFINTSIVSLETLVASLLYTRAPKSDSQRAIVRLQ